jgi:hypothetical protein
MKHVFTLGSTLLAGCFLQRVEAKLCEDCSLDDPIDAWFPELKHSPAEIKKSE